MTALAVVEPCPPALEGRDYPEYGGSVFFNEHGVGGCATCGWTGAPTVAGGLLSTWCPVCTADDSPPVEVRKVPRNVLCPCGSGRKAKKCDCTDFAV